MGQEGDDWKDMRELYAERKSVPPRRLPARKPGNLDRPLTPGEKSIWKSKSGLTPSAKAKLKHFRRGMGGGGWTSQD